MSDPVIHTFALGEYQTNCFVVQPKAGSPICWIVDCGYEPEPLLSHVEMERLEPQAILLTHCHCDHIAGLDIARSRLGDLPVYVHEAEAGWCGSAMLNLSMFAGRPLTVGEPNQTLRGGETLELGETQWRVLHTPGHSPGGVCFVHGESNQAIVGDTLFAGGMGRIDFPTSDPALMRRSLLEVIMRLPDDTAIFPGHGPSTTIGHERRTNPFIEELQSVSRGA